MRLTEFSSSRTQWHKHNQFLAQNETRFHRINQPEKCHTRYYGGSDSCRSDPFQRTATASDRSLCFMHITFGPFRLQPPDAFQGRFCTLPLISLDFPCGSGLHPSIPGSPPHPAESSSPGPLSHCPHDGLVVHLGLLSTLPRGNAVISSYGPENVCPTGTCTLLIVCTHRRTTAGVSPAVDPKCLFTK